MIAIDPGSERSALVWYEPGCLPHGLLLQNSEMLDEICKRTRGVHPGGLLVIEQVRGYGMQAGNELFDTCVWSGRFAQLALDRGLRVEWLPRLEVKRQLCGTPRANDAGVRQALIERFGGTKETAIGTKSRPGPLYGVKRDVWAALAVAVAWCEREAENRRS